MAGDRFAYVSTSILCWPGQNCCHPEPIVRIALREFRIRRKFVEAEGLGHIQMLQSIISPTEGFASRYS
ncbi:hypothetical protein B2J88_47130 [Rhodococcus sp. SRB_17]|nr:hypothetical protein [Rhodococcus sp. SRB_17]